MKNLFYIFILCFIFSCRKDNNYDPAVYVYPLLVQNDLNIAIYHNKNNDFDIYIFNNTGNQIMFQQVENLNQTVVDFESFEKGIYFVKIEGVNVEAQVKVVKE